MEYDLYPIIFENLMKLYNIDDIRDLYVYTYIRGSIYSGKKIEKMLEFILEELNISIFKTEGILQKSYIIYKEKNYYLEELSCIMENFKYRAGDFDIEEVLEDVYIRGYRKALNFKGLNDYKEYVKYYRLLTLNEYYEASISPVYAIKGFTYSVNSNPFKRSIEEKLEAIIAYNKLISFNTSYISERQLEDYLIDNLELIEKDMKFLNRQVKIKDGLIDILAIDKEDNICIIELKIEEDKKLLWQTIHYPKEIKKKYKKDIRMIVIAPSYNDYIFDALSEKVELMDYKIKVVLGEIEKLSLSKIKREKGGWRKLETK